MRKRLRIPPKTKSRGKKLLSQEGGFSSKVKPLRKKRQKYRKRN